MSTSNTRWYFVYSQDLRKRSWRKHVQSPCSNTVHHRHPKDLEEQIAEHLIIEEQLRAWEYAVLLETQEEMGNHRPRCNPVKPQHGCRRNAAVQDMAAAKRSGKHVFIHGALHDRGFGTEAVLLYVAHTIGGRKAVLRNVEVETDDEERNNT